jgi:hypothetical protein
VDPAAGSITIEREEEGGYDVIEAPLPAVVSVGGGGGPNGAAIGSGFLGVDFEPFQVQKLGGPQLTARAGPNWSAVRAERRRASLSRLYTGCAAGKMVAFIISSRVARCFPARMT